MVLRVGLTGGIASGKSMIRGFLEESGVPTIDADDIVHQFFREDATLQRQIREIFGETVITSDGSIDRKALGGIVFSDAGRKRQLEQLIHPKVREAIEGFFNVHADKPLAVAVVPLLFESGLEKHYDAIWLVKATEEQQIGRLMKNRGMSREEAMLRIRSQHSLGEKLNRLQALPHHAVIDNTGSPEKVREAVLKLIG